jgi:hypothetical protein
MRLPLQTLFTLKNINSHFVFTISGRARAQTNKDALKLKHKVLLN